MEEEPLKILFLHLIIGHHVREILEKFGVALPYHKWGRLSIIQIQTYMALEQDESILQ